MTVRRLKTYASSQGYVYQYYFVGQGPAVLPEATEYIFEVSSDGKRTYPVSIVVPRAVKAGWGEVHQRPLSDSEQYAAVKLRLFRAFDEIHDMPGEGGRVQIDEAFLEESLGSLGVE